MLEPPGMKVSTPVFPVLSAHGLKEWGKSHQERALPNLLLKEDFPAPGMC